MIKPLFITGLYRSGTTLVEKLLQNHQQVFLGSQSFPFLFFMAKASYCKENNIFNSVPLDTLFRNNTTHSFTKFLENQKLDKTFLDLAHQKSTAYKGLQNKEAAKIDIHDMKGSFMDVYNSYHKRLAKQLGKENTKYIGSKEILCDEYIPYFIQNGAKIVLVVRDPRDVISSLNFGKGSEFTGDYRPTLFNIRNWRKSIAFWIEYFIHPNVHCIKYEDLVAKPWNELEKAGDFLNINGYNAKLFSQGIKDQSGNIWKGNSSYSYHNLIENKGVGRYKEKLSQQTIDYIEATCFCELKFMGYETQVDINQYEVIISNFKEPFKTNRKEFEGMNYSLSKTNVDDEIKRFSYLSGKDEPNDAEDWFIFEKAYKELLKFA